METELLNEYRSEISRVWTDSETRFTSNGPVRRLDPKMASRAPAEVSVTITPSGRSIPSAGKYNISPDWPERKFKTKRLMPDCEDPRGHAWVSNGLDKRGRKREKCRWCARSRRAR